MIKDMASIFKGGEGEISFFFDKKKKDIASTIKTTACVTSKDFVSLIPENVIVLVSENPHDSFVKLNYAMYSEVLPEPKICESAKIASTAKIGKDCYIGEGVVIADNVIIGDNCLVGTNVSIINSDFHPISIKYRHVCTQKSKDVVIGNNVFIGSNVSICKGVTIGDNAVIGNGSVVFNDVEPNTIVRGNPAKFYKKIYEYESDN
jgi:acetyltransferase-like isoleucine patch superfamily enzyme